MRLEELEEEEPLVEHAAVRQQDDEVDARPDRVGPVALAVDGRVEDVDERVRRRRDVAGSLAPWPGLGPRWLGYNGRSSIRLVGR